MGFNKDIRFVIIYMIGCLTVRLIAGFLYLLFLLLSFSLAFPIILCFPTQLFSIFFSAFSFFLSHCFCYTSDHHCGILWFSYYNLFLSLLCYIFVYKTVCLFLYLFVFFILIIEVNNSFWTFFFLFPIIFCFIYYYIIIVKYNLSLLSM